VGSDESCISNGCPQQLEVGLNLALPAASPEEGIWELGGQGPISSEPNFDDLALSKVEAQAQLRTPGLCVGEGRRDSVDVTGNDAVIKIEGGQVEGARAKFLRQWLQSSSEQQRAQRVTLLDATSGLQDGGAKLQGRGRSIAPCSPSRQGGEVRADRGKDLNAADGVEGVLEIQLEQDFVL
jgi:hypothetical protein